MVCFALRRYSTDLLAEQMDGKWTAVEIVVSAADVPALQSTEVRVTFHRRCLLDWLEAEYGNKKYKGHFVVEAPTMRASRDPNRCCLAPGVC